MARTKVPYLPNVRPLIQAGINPETGLPFKCGGNPACIFDDLKRNFSTADKAMAFNRYLWYNLPNDIDGHMIERILYQRGQLALFYMESTDKFYALPFTLDDSQGDGLDIYGRYARITPVPLCGSKDDQGKDKPWIQGLNFKVIYSAEEALEADPFTSAVILQDYTSLMPGSILPRSTLQQPILDMMAEIYPMARTSLIANSGARGIRVNGEDEQLSVNEAGKTIYKNVLEGNPYVAITGTLDFQDLAGGSTLTTDAYLLLLQSLDNFRQAQYGIGGSSLFEKKAQELQAEQMQNCSNGILTYQDGLTNRQQFCDLANMVWGSALYCEAHPMLLGTPLDGQNMQEGPAAEGDEPTDGGEPTNDDVQ